jgi:hypothetical protein
VRLQALRRELITAPAIVDAKGGNGYGNTLRPRSTSLAVTRPRFPRRARALPAQLANAMAVSTGSRR